ncbi:restriction endonuclease subunit S, partial [Vibrio splendidus]
TIGDVLQPQSDGKLLHQGWSPKCHTEAADSDDWGVLKTTAIQDGFFLEEHNKKLPEDKQPRERIEVNPGDLLMTNAGPRARCGITTLVQDVRPKLMLSGKMYRMRFNQNYIYPRFIEACLRSEKVRAEIDARKTGMSESGLNLTQARFLTVPFRLAPLNEQIRIAHKLDSILAKVDKAQARLDKVPAILKRFRQSVLAAATSGELTKGEVAQSEAWENVKLLDVVEAKPRNGKSPKGVDFDTGIKNLTLSAITPGYFVENKFKFVDLDVPYDSHLWLKNQDILIQRANSIEYVGVSALYEGEDDQYIYPDLIMKCRANERVLSKYLYYALSSEPVRKYFRDNATGTTGNMPKINQAVVSAAPINLPKIDEQKIIVDKVESLFKKADKVEKQYLGAKTRLDRLTQSILAKAFRGELVPQDPNDEPAEQLLERILKEREQVAPKKTTLKRTTKAKTVEKG